MKKRSICFLAFILLFTVFSITHPPIISSVSREERRQAWIDYILANSPPVETISPTNMDPTAVNPVFIHLYLNRDPVAMAAANRYLEQVRLSGDRLKNDWDFISVFLYRVYFMFKDTGRLTPAATQNLQNNFVKFWLDHCIPRNEPDGTGNPYPECCNQTECYAIQNENHEILKLTLFYLAKEEFGQDTASAEAAIDQWITRIAGKNLEEYNSPVYTDRTMMGLLTLYDFAKNPRVKLKAQMILDALFAHYALTNLNQTRCGPATRAYEVEYTGDEESQTLYTNRAKDGMYEIGYFLFGHGGFPARIHISSSHNFSTGYQPPAIISQLATQNQEKSSYFLKTRGAHLGLGIDRNNIYYYVSPSFIIGTIQGFQVPSVPLQTQIWSLCLADSPQTQIFSNNAYFQYQNTIIYDSRYNYVKLGLNSVASANGWIFYEQTGAYLAVNDNVLSFRITYGGEIVERRLGLLEAREKSDFTSFDEFKNKILSQNITVVSKSLSYTNTFGETLYYNAGTNEAKVNGQIIAWNDYPLFESPYLNSAYESGLIYIKFAGQSLILDFQNMSRPQRLDSNTCPSYTLGNLDCDANELINESDLTIFLKYWGSQALNMNQFLSNWHPL